MKRIFLLIACTSALLLAACGSDSKLPIATGKGTIRAINAIPGSPEYTFKIEERTLSTVAYKQSTSPVEYDDFDYIFNFDVRFAGDVGVTRAASQALKVEADRHHILLLTGDFDAPTITVWDGDVREWTDTETVFEARFAHAGATLGDIDVYLDPAGTVPGTFAPAATLSFGDIADPIDFDEGIYVLTVTAANDTNTVYFTSQDVDYLPRFAHVITVFDGDGNDTGPVAVRSMTAAGNPLPLGNVEFPPAIRFIQTAYTLEPVDVYDDDLLTNLVVSNLQFKDTTTDIDTTSETKTYYFTPASSTATILFEQEVNAPAPGHYVHVYVLGDTDNWVGNRAVPNRAEASANAKLRFFHGALNYDLFSVYLKDRGEPLIEEDRPLIIGAALGLLTPAAQLVAGSYDIYLTEPTNKTEISAVFEIDVVAGDVVDLIAVDTVDPAVIELVDVTVP